MFSVPEQLRLLVIEDSDDDFAILLREIEKAGHRTSARRVGSRAELAAALDERWHLAITDWLLPGFSGLEAIDMTVARGLPCIVISGTPNEDAAVTALRAGALDFLSKDRPGKFVSAIVRALREHHDREKRRDAEHQLVLSEARYRAFFDHAPEALLTYDVEAARYVDANTAAQLLLGRTLDEIRAATIGGLSPEVLDDGRSTREVLRTLVPRLLAGQEVPPLDWAFVHASGDVVPCELRIVRLPSDRGNLLRVTVTDLRERRRIEQLRQRAAELELQNRRIQEANRLKSEFLANMSHELRTPLNAIIGFAELLHDGQVDPSSPQHQEFLGDILSSGRHLLGLINDVLDLAKVEAGKLDFRPERADLGRLVREVINITRTTAASKRIVVETAIEVDDAVLDPNRFKQVAYNYLSNALKFTPDGGRVAVRVLREGDGWFRLEVEDTGIGIAPQDLGKLFVEFQQLEAGAAKRHQGTGLGLALTRRLVEAQGGAVGVHSTPGKGSVFYAVLPRAAEIAVPRTTTRSPRLGPHTILVVEDEPRDREVLAAALQEAGYTVDVAATGAEAIARCQDHRYGAVTLDLLLPDMTGLDLLAALRGNGGAPPVVVVSVVPDARLVAGFAVHDVLHKPLDRGLLVSSLERAGVRPERQGGILVVDDDPSALRLMDATLAQLGFSAITRSTGASALDAAAKLKPAAVVLDLVMPEMDGIEFLDRLRRLPEHVHTPVLFWTAKDLTRDEYERLEQSAQGVVSKRQGTPLTVVSQLRALLGGA